MELGALDALEWEEQAIQAMRDDIAQLLADALQTDQEAKIETARVQAIHDEAIRHLELKSASRDTMGQAKGIIMATMRCTADEAFDLMVKQSQAENRKVSEIAGEIVARVARRANGA
jgi:hypothetical protein